jgi:hypothetical protein
MVTKSRIVFNEESIKLGNKSLLHRLSRILTEPSKRKKDLETYLFRRDRADKLREGMLEMCFCSL